MESVSAWLNDRKNLPIVAGAFVGILLIGGLVLFLTSRGSAPPPPSADMPGGATEPGAMPMPPGTDPAAMPTPPGTDPNAMPGAAGAGAAAPAAAPAGPKEPPLEEARADPFEPYLGPKPKRTKLAFTAQLPKPDIRRVEPLQVRIAQDEDTLGPQPVRRMAGIVKNGRIFAIIVEERGETPDTKIVKPGDMLNEDIMVDRILPDKVILKSQRTGTLIDVPKSAGRVQPRTPRADTTSPTGPRSPRMPMRPPGGGMGPMEMPPPPAP